MALLTRIVLQIIEYYKVAISPRLVGTCRFTPSCSAYAEAAIHRHGLSRGGWLTIRRLARCRPFGGRGHDPVP